MFARIRVTAETLAAVGGRRVTHAEAREVCGIRYKSDHLEGIAFPYFDPVDNKRIVTYRVRRHNPEQRPDGRPIAKYVSPPDRVKGNAARCLGRLRFSR
jgi:hypothetical protein